MSQEMEHTLLCRHCGQRIKWSLGAACWVHLNRREHCRDRRNRPAATFAQWTTWVLAE
jgi:hypothetical protein